MSFSQYVSRNEKSKSWGRCSDHELSGRISDCGLKRLKAIQSLLQGEIELFAIRNWVCFKSLCSLMSHQNIMRLWMRIWSRTALRQIAVLIPGMTHKWEFIHAVYTVSTSSVLLPYPQGSAMIAKYILATLLTNMLWLYDFLAYVSFVWRTTARGAISCGQNGNDCLMTCARQVLEMPIILLKCVTTADCLLARQYIHTCESKMNWHCSYDSHVRS